ncbi:hypothetical protein ACHAPT_013612, partial [Fusarium lateritium]
MDRSPERGPIAHNVQNVLKLFRNVATWFKQDTESLGDQYESDNPFKLLPTFENEVTRFKMWAGNLAAHQSGPASLDHRLREAPHLQEQVVYLLRDISESLEDNVTLTLNEEFPKGSKDTQEEPVSLQESLGQGSEEDFTDSDLDGNENVTLETRFSSLCTDVSEAIDCLLRLSVAIANPAPHERFRKLGAGLSEDVSFYEAHDIRYVRDKFPKASEGLPEVLGKFITRRRQFFKYREAHHAKLAAGLDHEAQKDTSRTEIVPKTVASSLPEQFKGTGVIDEDNRSDMAMSETSYATSAGFLLQEDGQMKPAPPLKVPPPPLEAEKGAFECPFCYRMVSASTRRAWKRHVFGDLRPYTCLFSQCTESNTDFDRRHRWHLHVSQYHWRTWSCPFKCGDGFLSVVALRDHIRHQHLPSTSDDHLSTLVARGEVPISNHVSKECPLCGHVIFGLHSYIKHVGRHLEQLALFALPNTGDETLEDDFDSDVQNDVVSDLDSSSADGDRPEDLSRADEQSETSEAGHQANWDIQDNTEQVHEPPNLPSQAVEPSADKDDGSYNLHDPDQPLEEDHGLQKSLGGFSSEVTEEHEAISGMMPEQDRGDRFETASEGEWQAHQAAKGLNPEIPSKPPSPPLQQQSGIGESEKQPRVPLESVMNEMQKVISPIDSVDEAGPATRDDRPTITRMSRRHVSFETLRSFNIDFDLDQDPEYVLIDRWVPEWEQDRLWAHTKTVREERGKPVVSEEWKHQSDNVEFEWVRKKPNTHRRRRARSQALLRYLAGDLPHGADQSEEVTEQPHHPSDAEHGGQELEDRGSEEILGDLATDNEKSQEVHPSPMVEHHLLWKKRLAALNDESPPEPTSHEEQVLSGDEMAPRGEGSPRPAEAVTIPTAVQDDGDSNRADGSEAVLETSTGKTAEVPEEIKLQGFFMCECCPDKPKRFETLEEL